MGVFQSSHVTTYLPALLGGRIIDWVRDWSEEISSFDMRSSMDLVQARQEQIINSRDKGAEVPLWAQARL